MEINKKTLELGAKASIIREIFEYSKKRSLEIGTENVFDFSLGNPSVNPPKIVEETIMDLLKNENPMLLHGYSSAPGDLNTRNAIANYVKTNFNVDLTSANIYMTCGAAASLTISLKAILNENEEVVVFAPFFTEYRVFVENAKGKLVISKPNYSNFQIDFDDFESKINCNTRAVIINSPNNPSGVVYSEDTIRALSDILSKKSSEYGKTIYLISDEPYRELVYDDVVVPYVMNYYKNSIVCYSYSKSLSLPGERIGYIAVNPKMDNCKEVYLSICGAGRSLGYVCAPSLFQQVITKCVGATSDISVYKENRDILYDNLTKFDFKCVKGDGAFYLLLKSPLKDEFEFFELAKQFEILFVPCRDFGIDGYVRIAYCVDKERIVNSLPSFKKLAEKCFG